MRLALSIVAAIGCAPVLYAAEDDQQAPAAEIQDITESTEETTSDDRLPLPEPLPLQPRQAPTPANSAPYPLDNDPDRVMAEVKSLSEAKRYNEALQLLRTYRARNPHDADARRLELAIEVAHNEHRMRAALNNQRAERLTILGDTDYLTAKAAATRPVVRRLDVVEFLVNKKRLPEALSATNAILEDHPYNEAVLSLKNAILRTMVEIERRRALKDRDVRHSEVLKEVIDDGTMPRQPQPIPRRIMVFDEDLNDQQRQAVQDRLNVVIDSISYQEAPVGEVLKLLFASAGMNYVILDEAISEQTVSMFLVDSTVAEVLSVLQNMVDIRFNYQGGSVYVTNSETNILTTKIIRLAAGLTNVMASPSLESMSGGGSGGAGSGAGGNGAFPPLGGGEGGGSGEGGGESDLERFLERIPELVDWPDGSTYYVEPKSNTLYVRSSPSTVTEVERLLHALDFNSVQILIEAKFIEVSEDAFRELGIDWKVGGFTTDGSDGVIAGGGQSGSTTAADLFSNLGVVSNPQLAQLAAQGLEQALAGATTGGSGATAASGLSVGVIGGGTGMNPNFEARLRALEGRGKANTLSEPKILTLSNSTGLIDISQDVSFVEDIENRAIANTVIADGGTSTGSTSNLPVPRFATESEGIRLRVVPSVARNSDIITMAIFPTVRELTRLRQQQVINTSGDGDSSAVNFVERPEFATRALATALHVKNGQTVVLGGLISERSQENRRGIPFLSAIPFAGALFRTDTKSSERRKLLIFVTARIIDPSGAELGEEERWLRDTARVMLPMEVQRQLREQEAEQQAEAQEQLEAYRQRTSSDGDNDDAQSSVRPGDFRARMQARRSESNQP